MIPKPSPSDDMQGDLFRVELRAILDMSHPLVKLCAVVDWSGLDKKFTPLFCDDNGRPATSVRLMVSLHYLKYTFDLSDDAALDGWVENPYWQHLSGMKFFTHKRPIDSSSMTRFRKRIGQAGAETMLRETIRAGLVLKAVRPHQLDRVNVDTTVQEKHVRFPTDTRLYDRARERLVKAGEQRGIALRQNYNRVGKRLLLKSSRYAHARQMKRARKCQRKLKTILGRVIRDIERKCPSPDRELQTLLNTAHSIHEQQRRDKNKIYSVHEPHVECIAKGKAHKKYEFGVKVSVVATSRGGWFVGAQAAPGNPYDGHTLASAMEQIKRIAPRQPKEVFADQGYRGHDYDGPAQVHVDKRRRGKTALRLWRWMKRRAAIEPGISHLKHGHRMDRNRLKGIDGDHINAIMSAAGMNFRKLLVHAALFYFFLREFLQIEAKKSKFIPLTPSYLDLEAA